MGDIATNFLRSDVFTYCRNVVAAVGVLVATKLGVSLVRATWQCCRAYLLAPLGIGQANFLKYGKWAVITGASEGIGRSYAMELARRGLNVVLMSRSREKLDKVAKEIEEKYGRETLVVAVDFSGGLEIYTDIANQINHLDVGVLVNNVGMTYPFPDRVANISAECLHRLVHLNCQPAVQMTRLVLPKMLELGGGYIINMSSIGSKFAAPQLCVYSATKKFINYFSDGLRKEYGSKGITVQAVCANFVSTAMTSFRRTSYFVLTPEDYVRSAIATVGIQDTTTGCVPHALQAGFMATVPTSFLDRHYNKAVDRARARRLRKAREQDKDNKKE